MTSRKYEECVTGGGFEIVSQDGVRVAKRRRKDIYPTGRALALRGRELGPQEQEEHP